MASAKAMRAPKSKNSQRKAVRILSQYYNGVSRWTIKLFRPLERGNRSIIGQGSPARGRHGGWRSRCGRFARRGWTRVGCVYSAQGSEFDYAGMLFRDGSRLPPRPTSASFQLTPTTGSVDPWLKPGSFQVAPRCFHPHLGASHGHKFIPKLFTCQGQPKPASKARN